MRGDDRLPSSMDVNVVFARLASEAHEARMRSGPACPAVAARLAIEISKLETPRSRSGTGHAARGDGYDNPRTSRI